MVIKIYVDMRSPPCRSVLKFLKASTIPYEIVVTDVLKGDQFKPDYVDKFPLKKVPAMQDGDFCISESVAIIRYLSSKFPGTFPDHWYPADLEKRASVDMYLAYHHQGLKAPFDILFAKKVVPSLTGQKPDPDECSKLIKACQDAFDVFEQVFLSGDSDFIFGNEITIADVFFSNEMVDSAIYGVDFLEGRPKVAAYVDRVRNRLNPAFDEIDKEFHEWRVSVLSGY